MSFHSSTTLPVTVAARDLPKLTTSSTSASTSSTKTSTSYSVTVTPPSPSGNPNIWGTDHRPDGTVFIAVGSIVGAIIAGLFVWWIVTNIVSRRIAKKSQYESLEGQFRGRGNPSLAYDYSDDKDVFVSLRSFPESAEESASKSKSNLLFNGGISSKSNLRDSNSWDSLPEFSSNTESLYPVEKVNPIQDNFPNHYKRNSLFVSPVIEVLQQQQQQQQQQQYDNSSRSRVREPESSSNPFVPSPMASPERLHKPERAASPERKQKKTPGNSYHTRNGSSLGISPVSSSVEQSNKCSTDLSANQKKGHKRQVPSMYLEDMLEGKDVA